MIANKLFNIPTVFTFLDYYLLCPQANFKKGDNKICNNPAICSGCAPFMKIMESRMSRNLAKKITGFITLTETSKKRLVSFGFKPDKIKVIYTYSIPKEFADKEYQVIVVDNASADGSVQMIKSEFPQVQLIEAK